MLQFPQTLPVLWLNQASHGNAKGTIGCRIECSIQPCGRNEDSLARKKKKNEKKDFFSIYHYHPVTVPTNIACFLVEPKVSQKCQEHHWMQNWMLYSTLRSEWGQLGKKKKKKKKDFFRSKSLETNIACFVVEQSVSQKCQGHHCRIECSIQPCQWGQLEKKKKKRKKIIFSLYHSSSHLKIPRTFPVSWLNKASHRNAKGTIGCRIECSIQPWGQNEDSLTTKKNKKEKKFSQHLSVLLSHTSHEYCRFSGWTKRLTEMPRAPMDAELNALFNHGVRMRTAWQQKKKEIRKIRFFQHLSEPPGYSTHQHCLFSGWTKRLTEMPRAPYAELNALFNPAVGKYSWARKKKRNEKISSHFFVISQQ